VIVGAAFSVAASGFVVVATALSTLVGAVTVLETLAVLTALVLAELPALFAGELPHADANRESPMIEKSILKYRIINKNDHFRIKSKSIINLIKMNKTAQLELHRIYLIDALPEPLTRASSHLQIYDNYIPGTRLRTRSIRDPYSKAWTYILQQRLRTDDDPPGVNRLAEMHLNEKEIQLLTPHHGREIRKNRYFHEFDRHLFAFDVYLGRLWGLNTVRIDFATTEEMRQFEQPPFAVFEITGNEFFEGSDLVTRTFADIQDEVARLGAILASFTESPDE